MNHLKGDMWSVLNSTDNFIFTANSFIKNNGALVMGRGIAKQVRDKWRGIDIQIGRKINHLERYKLIWLPMPFTTWHLGAFQVKYHFSEQAEYPLIRASALELATYANELPNQQFDMNYPGIGNGGLSFKEVEEIITPILPDNVNVWTFT